MKKLNDKKLHIYLGFKHGKLETIISSRNPDREGAIDCDYYIDGPQDAKKQVEAWLSEL